MTDKDIAHLCADDSEFFGDIVLAERNAFYAQHDAPNNLFVALEAVRHFGSTNMLARGIVADIAENFDFDDAAEWIRDHKGSYGAALSWLGVLVAERSARLEAGGRKV